MPYMSPTYLLHVFISMTPLVYTLTFHNFLFLELIFLSRLNFYQHHQKLSKQHLDFLQVFMDGMTVIDFAYAMGPTLQFSYNYLVDLDFLHHNLIMDTLLELKTGCWPHLNYEIVGCNHVARIAHTIVVNLTRTRLYSSCD